jgi:apolipoprotein N-acyltransferase
VLLSEVADQSLFALPLVKFTFTQIFTVKRFTHLLIAMIGSLLLWAAWPTSVFTVLIFIAWLPLLWIEDRITNWKRLFAITYLHMLGWNVLVTWWIYNASLPGALGAFLANSLIMCVPWLLFHFTKRNLGRWVGYGSLIIYWLAFEYLHHNWELSWPWLTLGNSFAIHPEWVQWYEYSGSSGGSLWVLLSNVLAYTVFKEYRSNGRTKAYYITIASWILLLILPILISRVLLNSEKKFHNSIASPASKNVVIIQPNVDPYEEKFSAPIESQIQHLITLSEQQTDNNTALVIWPETAIPVSVWEDHIKDDYYYHPIWSFLQRHPGINLLSGINSRKDYGTDKNNATATSRLNPSEGNYYDEFNTAGFFDADTTIDLYHKAKLVPGVETLPSFLGFMGKWFEDFGGISGTLGRDSERKVFVSSKTQFKAAPIICYESIYSDYITEYVRKGANILTIITNDGWWGNTPGYRQHMNYARLRAVETRKWVARSANTGISCFIDPLGNVILPQPWDTVAAIKLNIPIDDRQTFYVRNGDILSRAAVAVTFLLLLTSLGWAIKRRMRKNTAL